MMMQIKLILVADFSQIIYLAEKIFARTETSTDVATFTHPKTPGGFLVSRQLLLDDLKIRLNWPDQPVRP